MTRLAGAAMQTSPATEARPSVFRMADGDTTTSMGAFPNQTDNDFIAGIAGADHTSGVDAGEVHLKTVSRQRLAHILLCL